MPDERDARLEETLVDLKEAWMENRALRAELGKLDERLAALERSAVFRVLRAVGLQEQLIQRKAGPALSQAGSGRRTAPEHWFQDAPMPRYSIGAALVGRGPELLARWGGVAGVVRPSFDADAYRYFNADDMAGVFGGGLNSAFAHWMRGGRREGREGGARSAAVARGRVEGPAGLNLYGFLSSMSGLGTAARSVRKAVEASGLAGAYFDLPNWEHAGQGGTGVERGAFRTNLLFQNSDLLPRFARTYGQELLKGRYNIAHCVWELPSLRADWAENLRYVDEVWTPSEFNRAAYQAATPLPVRVIPYTVDGLEAVATLNRTDLGVPEGVFLFSYVFDVSSGFDRKNPLALLEAFQEEFGGSRDAYLLLKCFNGTYNPRRMAMLRRLAAADNIGLVEERWTEAQIHTLHKVTDCFVSPHRGEGFGLNIAETMYFGNAVVGSNYGANVDFMDEGNSYPAGYRLVEIEQSTGPYLKGNVWAEVDVEDLARQMRRAFEDTAERRRRGDAAARTIREKYSVEAVGRLIRARLAEIDQPVAVHPERPLWFLPKESPAKVRAEVHRMRARPRISVIVEVEDGDGERLKRCVDSVRAQWYPYWELCLCGGGSAYRGADPRIKVMTGAANRGAEFATGEWMALLGQEDYLTPDALMCVARALGEQPDLDVLYTDDETSEKPEWSPEQLQAEMYMRRMLVVRKQLFWELGGFRREMAEAREYDLALRLAGRTNRIGHLPKALYHGQKGDGALEAEVEAGRHALEEFVRQEKLPAMVEPGLRPGLFRVKYRVVGQPKVTLVIQARGDAGRLDRLARSIVEKTEYPNYEVVVAHAGDLRLEECEELVVLMRDDVEVRGVGWLEALLEYAQQPWIGAVYPSRGDVVRNYSEAAAGCVATRKSVLTQVGWSGDCGGAAFCRALRELGYRVVYTPYSELN